LLFGKAQSPKELLAKSQESIQKSIRELDRERNKLQEEDKNLLLEIKAAGRRNNMAAVKIMTKNLIRKRNTINKFYQMKAQLQDVSSQISTMSSTNAMKDAMKGAAKAMHIMNMQMDLPAMQSFVKTYAFENEQVQEKQKLMDKAIDEMMTMPEDEKEEAELMSQILDEIGIKITTQLADAPNKSHQLQQQTLSDKKVSTMETSGGGPNNNNNNNVTFVLDKKDYLGDDLTARLEKLRK
jgi:charged multivesicular body protein 2A